MLNHLIGCVLMVLYDHLQICRLEFALTEVTELGNRIEPFERASHKTLHLCSDDEGYNIYPLLFLDG